MGEKRTVQMTVTAVVTLPDNQPAVEDVVKSMAMSAITQHHEVACGRDVGPNYDRTAWADVYAEVSDTDCEIIE